MAIDLLDTGGDCPARVQELSCESDECCIGALGDRSGALLDVSMSR